jgi:nitroimidazol reductase NimA-like FMN-containing flavoprotein (pyridoxamine 5'-phosphate oxidase superfamily)
MFHEMRRSDRLLSDNDVQEILEVGEYGILSTIGENGYPYGVPISYVYIDSKIYFHCAAGVGLKEENITYCDNVCFIVVGKTEVLAEKFSTKYESIIAFGKAKKCIENKQKALEGLIKKYSSEFMEKGLKYIEAAHYMTDIYEITIESITGKGRR